MPWDVGKAFYSAVVIHLCGATLPVALKHRSDFSLSGLPWDHWEGQWRSKHLCWGGSSPSTDALGKVFQFPAEDVTCEFRNVCYSLATEEFVYSKDSEPHRPLPPVSIWSGPPEPIFGGYDAPRKVLPLHVQESLAPQSVLSAPTYVILRGASSNLAHMIHDMMLPLVILLSQAEGSRAGGQSGRRLIFFLDDCNPSSIYNSPPAMPKLRRNTKRDTCERFSDMLVHIISDWPWLDVERLREADQAEAGKQEICFSRLIAGSGRYGLFSGYSEDRLSGLYLNTIASGLLGTHMRMLRDWAYERVLDPHPTGQSHRGMLALVRKPSGERRDLVNLGEVTTWLADWAETHRLQYVELRLWAMNLQQQLTVLCQVRILVTHAGSTHAASSIFLPDWASVIVIPQCGGCKPAEDIREDCSGDSLYLRPCSADEMTFDFVWPRPLLRIFWYPATLQDTEERVGHLDVRINHSILVAVLEEASQHMDFHMPEPQISELPKLRIFSYTWPEMLHLPLLLRCAEEQNRGLWRTCATSISETYCGLLHRRPAYMETAISDLLPSLGSCSCVNAALEAGASGVSWNWQQLSNVAFLKLQLARHELLFWSGLTMDTMTNILFGMPHSVMGFFGHPSLLELLRRRAFYEDTEGLECFDRDDCTAKRVLTLIEWLMVARNLFCEHGGLSTWELASDEESIDLIDFRRHTLLVDTMFVELLRDAQDSTWGPSVKLLLKVLQEELAVDFGLKFRVTSPWCSNNISAESAGGEPARLFTDLDFSWFSELCALRLEPQEGSEANEAVDLEYLEPHTAEERSTCNASDASEGSPLKRGDLLFHVLGRAVVSPQHRLTDSAMEVEVLLFVYSLDGCIPVVREKVGHVLSQPAVPLFPWRCSFDGWSGQAVPVSMMGFTLTIVCPVPAWIRQPSLLRLFAEPQDIQLPIPLCQKQSQPKERLRLAICLRIHYDIRGLIKESGLPYLVRDWMNFHLLSGVDKLVIYDEDGSFGDLDADLSRHPRVSYFPRWPETFLPLLSSRLQLGRQEVGKDSLAAQANSHCVMMLKGQVDWIAMLPGFDTFLWTSQSSKQTGALKAVLATVEPHRPKLAALQLMEVQYTQGNYPKGSTLLSQRMRGPAITNQSHTLVLNPENVLEVGMGHFALPRQDAHLVAVEESLLRVNHYIDFVESDASRCQSCTFLDDMLSPELESELEMMRKTT